MKISLAKGNRIIGFLRAIPPVVPIHTKIAPGQATKGGIFGQFGNKVWQADPGIAWQHITAIGKGMDHNRNFGLRQPVDNS